jgi:hypothetical protein
MILHINISFVKVRDTGQEWNTLESMIINWNGVFKDVEFRKTSSVVK